MKREKAAIGFANRCFFPPFTSAYVVIANPGVSRDEATVILFSQLLLLRGVPLYGINSGMKQPEK